MKNNLHELTENIHELLGQINTKYDLGMEIKNYEFYSWDPNSLKSGYFVRAINLNGVTRLISIPLIQAPQIRQILLALKDVLGKEVYYWYPDDEEIDLGNVLQQLKTKAYDEAHQRLIDNDRDFYWKIYTLVESNNLPLTQSEALCKTWLDGLTPMIDQEPEKVLEELKAVLQELLK